MRPADLLNAYVRGLCSLTGARGVSLFVPAPSNALTSPILVHEGDLPPVPELSDLERAEAFRREIAPRLRELRRVAPAPAAVAVASVAPDARLIGFFSEGSALVPDRRSQGRHAHDASAPRDQPAEPLPDLWLGLRLAQRRPPQSIVSDLVQLEAAASTPRALDTGWAWLTGFACELARHTRHVSEVLDDPVTGLPGRPEFQIGLERAVEKARDEGVPLTLLLLNPDDFAALNERISREAADKVIREIAERLKAAHRSSDLVARYGSVVFATLLFGTDAHEGMRRAEQILQRLHASAFLGGEVPIRFSLGAASCEAQERGVRRGLDLIRRANVALSAAKQSGGGRLATWQPGAEEQVGYLDRLTGIFTGQLSKDYRNMAVLSDTVSILAGHDDPHVLAVQVVKELHAAMKPERVGLFEWSDEGGLRLIYGLSGRVAGASGEPGQGSHEGLLLHDDERLLLEATRTRRRAEERSGGEATEPTLSFAVPLLAGEKALGALYLAGRSGPLGLDSSDLVFLEALASQVALALDRARLSEQQRQHEEQERRRLRAEVDELRNALRRSQFLYRSGQMEALLDRVKRVAPTNATVLLLGESGTGKEMLARAIHQLSPRRDQPFVVVDCGAIPTTLIESELFGHEKGAFTGAQQRQLGRLVQADKGTLLLDEIGELPLEAQSRLLRFVQERHVTPIGGRAGRAVDVRVLAATNRDLQKEVGAGRFRADLYHRLNVVRLEIPPLRARPDDILHLAHHFREAYSLLYGRGPFTFSPDAEALIVGHPWPGNVRELENRVMRAVILCQGPALTQADLGFAEDATGPLDVALPASLWAKDVGAPAEPPAGLEEPPGVPEAPPERVPTAPLSFAELRPALQREIQRALAAGEPVPPLGRWLADDLVLEADAAAAGVGSRAATILGMPETTLRRRVDRARAQAKAGWSLRSESWPGVRAALAELVRSEATGGGLFRQTQRILFEEVVAKAPDDPRTAAALLGVTLPTFRRRSEAADALGSSEPG